MEVEECTPLCKRPRQLPSPYNAARLGLGLPGKTTLSIARHIGKITVRRRDCGYDRERVTAWAAKPTRNGARVMSRAQYGWNLADPRFDASLLE